MSTAAIFPGQGSQAPRSGEPWQQHPSWSLVEQAAAATGVDVAHLLLVADADEGMPAVDPVVVAWERGR